MKNFPLKKVIIASALFGAAFAVLHHFLVLKDFVEYDVVKDFAKGKGEVTYNIPLVNDQYFFKYSTSDNYKKEDIDILINAVPVADFRSDHDNGKITLQALLPAGLLKPGTNYIMALKKKSVSSAEATDRVTIKNSRKKAVKGNLFILFKSSPLIPRGAARIIAGSLVGWLAGFLVMFVVISLSLKLLARGRSVPDEKLLKIDLWTYVLPLAVLSGLFISSFLSKYYLILTCGFFWFGAVFFAVISKIIIYVSTAFRREFASGFLMMLKKAAKNPVNTMIIVGLFLILLIPLPGLIYPYFPIRNPEIIAQKDSEIFANIAYVLLVIGAVLKFIKDFRRLKSQSS